MLKNLRSSDISAGQQFCFVLALTFLAWAIQVKKGLMSFVAIVALMFFVIFLVTGFALYWPLQKYSNKQFDDSASGDETSKTVGRELILVWFLKMVLLVQLGFFVWVNPQLWVVGILIGTTMLLDAPNFGFRAPTANVSPLFTRWLHWRPSCVLAVYATLCLVCIISDMPTVHRIDVYYFQQYGARALLNGANPYEMRLPSLYPPGTPFYAPELVKDGMLQFGYVYMPFTLLLAVPGYLLGDVRLALFAALFLSGAIIMRLGTHRGHLDLATKARTTQIGVLVGSLLLLYPHFLYLIIHGWSDNFVTLFFCIVVLCAIRKSPWLPVAVGLWLASKQYVVLLLPLTLMLLPPHSSWGGKRRFYGIVLGTALLVSLPMILWNVREFLWSALQLQFHQPLRDDALSLLVAFKLLTGIVPPFWIPFVALMLTIVWALRVAPRTPHGFCAACTLVFTAFIALNKQAFINYYFVVFAMLCCTVATFHNSVLSGGSSLSEQSGES